ncbi:MAG: class I SAM-dependent methyltransferase [Chloroflexi bacterium]|nr:class I SAM-dependent methyltransferase [Chloroflexota bacterium]
MDRQEKYRRRYASMHPGWKPSSQVYEDTVAAHLNPEVRVLDLGCGRGGVLERLHARAAFAAGIDPDWLSLVEHRVPALPLTCGVADALPYRNECFDLVCCSWVLEHVSDPGLLFNEVRRVLAAGGRFVFLTPNAHHPLLRLNRALGWTRGYFVRQLYGREETDTFPALYRVNAISSIRQFAAAAGLEERMLEPVADPTYLAFSDLLFRLATLLERVTPVGLRIHLVGDFAVPQSPTSACRS